MKTVAKPAASDAAAGVLDFAGLVRGDQAAFRAYYDAYADLILFVARRFGLAPAAADDVLQETFYRLFRKARTIEGASKVKPWLVTTARRLVIDQLRKSGREAPMAAGDARERADLATGGDGQESLEREVELKAVADLVAEIAETPGGETFRAFYVEGLTAKAIASRNGEAVSTVTTRLSRLRRRFSERFREHLSALRDEET
jgi:RNA polymerase sigma-70 factor (ECF subfamily)